MVYGVGGPAGAEAGGRDRIARWRVVAFPDASFRLTVLGLPLSISYTLFVTGTCSVVPSVFVTLTDVLPFGTRPRTIGVPEALSVVTASPCSSAPDILPHTPPKSPGVAVEPFMRQSSVEPGMTRTGSVVPPAKTAADGSKPGIWLRPLMAAAGRG